ncbi:hypothetical protein ES319_A09G166200v1 [Gossypium barbadense]|uniref:Uncharacterized protein n=2 Tax=Gossypium TaxID=3633 RepID=A0A5J5UJ31_GOSBA|nr:hypothetical protein ES319_A09G166200v1 [Gossypium barbadense]TYH03029.1 hypothetical protein ES288_A09G188100v1 [Gossypium darwinii]
MYFASICFEVDLTWPIKYLRGFQTFKAMDLQQTAKF